MNGTDNTIRDKPNFMIIGSAKCGTTSLYDDLARIDGLFLPSDKEPSILTKSQNIVQIQLDYCSHFRGARPNQLCGEASTDYTKIPQYGGIADKAYRLCGDELKLIMIMRDPIQRIYSQLRHNIATRMISPKEIDRVVLDDPMYVSVSAYALQIKPWLDLFGIDKLFCVSFSEYRQNRAQTIHDLGKFLGVNTNELILDEKSVSNKSSELRYTNRNIARLLGSPFYRRYIRRWLSDNTRGWYRNLLLPKASVPDIKLSNAVEEELNNRLGNVEHEVEVLLGRRIQINETR